jgi:hypothetical protein
MPKPSDVFLGIIEFFAVLLPGALVTWMLWRWPCPITLDPNGGPFQSIAKIADPFLPRDAKLRWVAFAVVSWGIGQVLFAAAPPIDWAWDWVRHYKRINKKNKRLTDPADEAVVALRFALLGLAFPAVTDYQSRWFGLAWPNALPVILILVAPALYIYIAVGLGWVCIIVLIILLSCWLSFLTKGRKADVVVAEKEASREHSDWAQQYLRQVNIASFPAPVPLSAIKGAAKDTEEAARKLDQLMRGRNPTQQISAQMIDRLRQTARRLGEQAGIIQNIADSADVLLKQADQAATDLQQANDAVDYARYLVREASKSSPLALRLPGIGRAIQSRSERRRQTAQESLGEAESRQIEANTTEDNTKKNIQSFVTELQGQVDTTEIAQRQTLEAAQPILTNSFDLTLQAAVAEVQTTFASVTGGTAPAIRRVIEFSRQKQPPSFEAIGNYDFACSVLRARAPAALAEVERLQAQSKFFRSLTTGIFLFGYLFLLSLGKKWPEFDPPWTFQAVSAIWGVSLVLSILLYNRMRKNAVDEAYQSAVVAFAVGGRVESGAAVKGGAQG